MFPGDMCPGVNAAFIGRGGSRLQRGRPGESRGQDPLFWFDSRQTLDKVSRSDLTLQLDSGTLNTVEVARNLAGVHTA